MQLLVAPGAHAEEVALLLEAQLRGIALVVDVLHPRPGAGLTYTPRPPADPGAELPPPRRAQAGGLVELVQRGELQDIAPTGPLDRHGGIGGFRGHHT
jgi:hypothetical protein